MATVIAGPTFKPGIYFDIPPEEYHAAPGLSHSGMKDLMVSPLRYWHLHINPDREPVEPTAEMVLGTAVHALALEPESFDQRYIQELDASDIEGCLVTMADLRGWATSKGLSFTARTKEDMVQVIRTFCDKQRVKFPPIFDLLKRDHEERTAGRVQLNKERFHRVVGAADSLLREQEIQAFLGNGKPEVSIFATDPETGVLLKARMDWVSPGCTLDLKTFTQMRGRSIDDSVARAIFYEGYYRQAYYYTLLRALVGSKVTKFVFGFVESEQPHEVRIRQLSPKGHGEAHAYWERAHLEVQQLIQCYAYCQQRFGSDPWRSEQEVELLRDEELPGLG